MIHFARNDSELSQWVHWASERGNTATVVRTVAEAALMLARLITFCCAPCWWNWSGSTHNHLNHAEAGPGDSRWRLVCLLRFDEEREAVQVRPIGGLVPWTLANDFESCGKPRPIQIDFGRLPLVCQA
jgi:hypothetical protein